MEGLEASVRLLKTWFAGSYETELPGTPDSVEYGEATGRIIWAATKPLARGICTFAPTNALEVRGSEVHITTWPRGHRRPGGVIERISGLGPVTISRHIKSRTGDKQ